MMDGYLVNTLPKFAALLVTFLHFALLPGVLWAQAVLENPRQGSVQSGVGLVSGWKCAAGRIEIAFDDDPPVPAAYGTVREDTLPVCNDTNNGFGLLFNWNRLEDGSHTVRALADGVEFARSTITVVTLGEEFLTDAREDFTLKDFPVSGKNIRLQWEQSLQNFVIIKSDLTRSFSAVAQEATVTNAVSAPKGVLENPQDGSFASGVSVISGWVCNAGHVDIEIDGVRYTAGSGTDREDTADTCGNDGNNGFGLLFNWNRLTDGEHTVRAFADGVEFGRAAFTVTTLGREFFPGLNRAVLVENFPEGGTNATLQWEESLQNFIIKEASVAKCGGATPCTCGDTVQASITLTADITGCPSSALRVLSGVVLDCAGHSISNIQPKGQGHGVMLDNATNAEVRNCRISNFRRGLRISGGSGNRLLNNESFNNRYGIDLANATTGNLIQGNSIHDSRDEGIHIGTGADHNEIRGNTFRDNKRENIYLLRANGNLIVGNISTGADNTAIFIKHSSANTIADNITADTPIQLRGDSVGNTLVNNQLTGNGYFFEGYEEPPGVWTYPHNNQVTGGSVNGAYACLRFSGAYDNRVDQLQLSNCGVSVLLESRGGREPTGNEINTIPPR